MLRDTKQMGSRSQIGAGIVASKVADIEDTEANIVKAREAEEALRSSEGIVRWRGAAKSKGEKQSADPSADHVLEEINSVINIEDDDITASDMGISFKMTIPEVEGFSDSDGDTNLNDSSYLNESYRGSKKSGTRKKKKQNSAKQDKSDWLSSVAAEEFMVNPLDDNSMEKASRSSSGKSYFSMDSDSGSAIGRPGDFTLGRSSMSGVSFRDLKTQRSVSIRNSMRFNFRDVSEKSASRGDLKELVSDPADASKETGIKMTRAQLRKNLQSQVRARLEANKKRSQVANSKLSADDSRYVRQSIRGLASLLETGSDVESDDSDSKDGDGDDVSIELGDKDSIDFDDDDVKEIGDFEEKGEKKGDDDDVESQEEDEQSKPGRKGTCGALKEKVTHRLYIILVSVFIGLFVIANVVLVSLLVT